MSFHTGTCSWAEKALIESREFYPPEAKTAESRLRHYACHFDTVEVDSSFYAIPRPQNSALWASRTPHGFTFHVKAYGALTGHAVTTKALPQDIRAVLPLKEREAGQVYIRELGLLGLIGKAFSEALRPLGQMGKLGIIVFQFPPWFHYSTKNMDDILSRLGLVQDLPVGVEFRHGSWLLPDRRDTVFKFLRDNGITYIAADEPQYGNLETVPLVPAVTTDTAYFRLHGRNSRAWRIKGATTAEKFAYNYSDDELSEVKDVVMDVAREAKKTFVMFNNHGSPGIRNAEKMKVLLG